MVKILVRLAFACLAMELVAEVRGQTGDCEPCNVSTCENETVLQDSCLGTIVADPCGCCKQCGRVYGETCGGAFGYLGTCEYGLVCTANKSQYLKGVNISGFCTRRVCRKNCSRLAVNRVCGNDGRWYLNKCELRQSKFCNETGVSATSEYVCDRACTELQAPTNGNVSFSRGIAQTSVASFACDPPYILRGNPTRTCGETHSAIWHTPTWSGTQPVCADPCENHTCDGNFRVCIWDISNGTQCVCESEDDCVADSFVCASNGISYPSECHMRASLCQNCLSNSLLCTDVAVYVISRAKCPHRR